MPAFGMPQLCAWCLCRYVMQDDVLFYNLTVRETFTVAAALRLPGSTTSQAKSAVVTEVIDELGLIKAADTYIGGYPLYKGCHTQSQL